MFQRAHPNLYWREEDVAIRPIRTTAGRAVCRSGVDNVRQALAVLWVWIALASAAISVVPNGCAPGPSRDAVRSNDASFALEQGDTATAISLLAARAGERSARPETFLLLARLYRFHGSITDRLRAQGFLEEGLRRYPDHTELLTELGATLYAQTMYGDAERVFRHALEIEPERCEAHYYLGVNAYRKWKRVQSFTDYLAAAERHLSLSVACDTTREDAYLKLAFSRCVRGDTARALEACDAYRASFPAAPEPHFLSGCIAYASGDLEACRDRFDEALSLLGEDERTVYTGISSLVGAGAERDAYDAAAPSIRAEQARLYWVANDPDPTTEMNERFLEHVYRVFMSGLRYESSTPPIDGWETSRGRALVKFGEPDHLETTLGGALPMDGRTEIWAYLETDRPFVLFFRDEYLNGNYVIPMEDVISASTLREDPPISSHVPDAAEVPGTLGAFVFRDSDTTASVFLVHAVNADSLDRHLWSWQTERFLARASFFREDGRPFVYLAWDVGADSLAWEAQATPPLYVAVKELSLPFDGYRAAFSMEDEHGVARSLAWADIAASRFIGESLSASDLILGSRWRVGCPTIHRRGRALAVNAAGSYPPGESLLLYLELYNLEVRNGRSACELSYSIRRRDTRRGLWDALRSGAATIGIADEDTPPVISQSFRWVGASDTAAEEISVGIDALEPGTYEVTMTAVDSATGGSVSASRMFVKAPGSRGAKK